MEKQFLRSRLEQLSKNQTKKRPRVEDASSDEPSISNADEDEVAEGLMTNEEEGNDENAEPELVAFDEQTTIRGGKCLWNAGMFSRSRNIFMIHRKTSNIFKVFDTSATS